MLDDWNGDGRIDDEDQMLQDEFDDWAMEQYRKRNEPASDDLLIEDNDSGVDYTDSTPDKPPVTQLTAQRHTFHRPAPAPKHVPAPEPTPRPAEPQKTPPKDSGVRRGKKGGTRRGFAVLIALVLFFAITHHIYRTNRVDILYRNAQEYCLAGSYDEAEKCLYQLWDLESYSFRDVWDLLCYCDGRSYYERGDIEGAYREMNKGGSLKYLPDERSIELEKEYRAFQAKIRREYAVYQAEQEKQAQEAFENRIVNGVPFVGMPESRIAGTTLGRPDTTVRHNTEIIRGKAYTANLYDWLVNGHRIYSARCIKGEVVQVWDERDKDTSKPYVPISYTPKKKTPSRYDDYDVYDYDDPEDFYYDHEDEFEDYEDAEDYYDEAWGN